MANLHTSKYLHEIKNINGTIQNIEFSNSDNYYEITITIKCSTGGESIFAFCMGSVSSCCEILGWYYSPNTPSFDNITIINNNPNDLDKLPDEVNKYNGDKIENINIYEPERESSMVMEINLENDKKFNFVMFNCHNGYYPHDVCLNVYENGDIKPMRVFYTSL